MLAKGSSSRGLLCNYADSSFAIVEEGSTGVESAFPHIAADAATVRLDEFLYLTAIFRKGQLLVLKQ